MNKIFALAAAITTSAATAAIAAETTCTAAPSCTDLGYKQSASVCSGKYIKCPFDTSKVMCVNGGPHIGYLKYSLYSANHDGCYCVTEANIVRHFIQNCIMLSVQTSAALIPIVQVQEPPENAIPGNLPCQTTAVSSSEVLKIRIAALLIDQIQV